MCMLYVAKRGVLYQPKTILEFFFLLVCVCVCNRLKTHTKEEVSKMSAFFSLSSSIGANYAVEPLVASIALAQSRKDVEERAAIKIQSIARMSAQRAIYKHLCSRILDVQRCFRGYLGRKKFLREQIRQQVAFNQAVFDHFATLIQSRFRGYILRKKHCDFYARKKYIMDVVDKSESVRQMAQETFEVQHALHEETQKRKQLEEFRKVTANLHHLLSTCSVSGIYRPVLAVDGVKTVFGTTIEDELRSVPIPKRKFKPDLPQQDNNSNGKVATDAHTTDVSRASQVSIVGSTTASNSRVPHAPVGSKLGTVGLRTAATGALPVGAPGDISLQNAVPYQVEKVHESLSRAVDKKLADSIHKGSTFLARKTDPPTFGVTIAAESQYVEKKAVGSRRR